MSGSPGETEEIARQDAVQRMELLILWSSNTQEDHDCPIEPHDIPAREIGLINTSTFLGTNPENASTSVLPVDRRESQRLSGADFPEEDFLKIFGVADSSIGCCSRLLTQRRFSNN
jgi:hypothetical protein